MEDKKHRVVVYENEWAPVRRFARKLYQWKQCLKMKKQVNIKLLIP